MLLKIQKADKEGVIRMERCAQALYMGVRSFEPYVLYLEAEEDEKYTEVVVRAKVVGERITVKDMMESNVAVVSSAEGTCLFFTPKPKLQMGGNQGPSLPPGMSLPGRSFPQ